MKKGLMALFCLATLFGVAGVASAAPLVDVSSIAVDTTALATLGGEIIAGLAGIWGFRKIVKSINRT